MRTAFSAPIGSVSDTAMLQQLMRCACSGGQPLFTRVGPDRDATIAGGSCMLRRGNESWKDSAILT